MILAGSYTCDLCRKRFDFEEDWTETDAAAEFDRNFPGEKAAERAVVCDDCYLAMLASGSPQ